MKEHIELDLEIFKTTFKKKESEDDRPKIMQFNGNMWIYSVGTNHISLLKLMTGDITTWSVKLEEGLPIVRECPHGCDM